MQVLSKTITLCELSGPGEITQPVYKIIISFACVLFQSASFPWTNDILSNPVDHSQLFVSHLFEYIASVAVRLPGQSFLAVCGWSCKSQGIASIPTQMTYAL